MNGQWLAFYDQALKVELENGKRFLTNWRYSLKEYVQSDPIQSGAKGISDVQIDDYDKFYSACDRTMIGVIHDKGRPSSMAEHHIECFYAVKEDSDKAVEQKLAEQAKQQKLVEQEAADAQLLLIDQ